MMVQRYSILILNSSYTQTRRSLQPKRVRRSAQLPATFIHSMVRFQVMIFTFIYFSKVWRSIWLASYALGLESDIFWSYWLFMATFVHFSYSFSQNFNWEMGESTLHEVYCWNSFISNFSSTVGFGISGQAGRVRRRSWSATKYNWVDFAALDNIAHIQVCFDFKTSIEMLFQWNRTIMDGRSFGLCQRSMERYGLLYEFALFGDYFNKNMRLHETYGIIRRLCSL